MKLARFLVPAALLLCTAMASAQPAAIWQEEVRRKDLGTPRRAKLSEMELKAAPSDLFGTLTDWTGGPAATSDAIKGKVVLVMTFSSWEPSNVKAFERAAKLAEANADKGLVVVAAHGDKLWDGAQKLASERKFKGLLAKDDGKLRSKLLSVQDPDFYIIDRAGQMRFAGIETDAVSKGVELALAETPESAANQINLLKGKIADAKREFDKPIAAGNIPGPGKKAKVAFQLPDSGAFEKAAWEEKNKDTQSIGANDVQGARLPNADTFGQKEIWLTEKPDWNGKVLVLHFWGTPIASFRSMNVLRDLFKSHADDLCIIGFSGIDASDDQRNIERFFRTSAGKDLNWYHCWDDKQTLAKALSVRTYPHVVVISTDGTVRWQGMPGDYRFRKIVELTIEVDPGVQARRAAEAAAQKAAEDAVTPGK